jgi:CelD/BcsL family acetyltransferase involved in cellulose biosynthesis
MRDSDNPDRTPEASVAAGFIDRAPVAAERTRLTVEFLLDEDELKSNKSAWEALVARVPTHVFQSYEWISCWWRHFGANRDRSLYVCMFRSGRQLVGIVPFFSETRTLAGFRTSRRLRLAGCGVTGARNRGLFDRYSPSDFLDGIVDPVFATEVAAELKRHLRANSDIWDELDLSNLREDSFFLRHFLPLIDPEYNSIEVRITDACPYLLNPVESNEYIETLKPSVRRRMAQALKSMIAAGETEINSAQSSGDVEALLGTLVDLHQARWNNMGYPGVFSDERFLRFQEEVAQEFLTRGWLWLKMVCIAGAPAAVRMGFKFKESMYDYLSGFDDRSAASKKRPGLGLLMLMMDDAARSNTTSFEFLRGAEQYKFEMTEQSLNLSTLRLTNASVRSPLRRAINALQRVGESITYRIYIENASFKTNIRRHAFPAGVVKYLSFRAGSVRAYLRSRVRPRLITLKKENV